MSETQLELFDVKALYGEQPSVRAVRAAVRVKMLERAERLYDEWVEQMLRADPGEDDG